MNTFRDTPAISRQWPRAATRGRGCNGLRSATAWSRRARDRADVVTLCHRVGVRQRLGHHRMPGLVVGGVHAFFSLALTMERRSAPIMTLSLAFSKSAMSTTPLLRAREQRRLVHQVGEIGTGKAGRAARDDRGVDIVRHRYLAHMHLEYLLAARMSGSGTYTWAVETAGAQQRRVEHVRAVVAAMMITPSLPSKPSISTSNWLRVCSRSSCPPPRPAPRWRPTASISSMK